jgi:hypothetical protein
MTSIIRLKKLFILYFEIVTKSKNALVKFTFSICNQQLLFTFVIPYSLYTNDNDNNGSRPPTLNKTFEFFNEIYVKMGIKLGWNAWINDTMVVDSIVMITCMSPFSKPLLDFDSMQKNSTFTNMPFYKCCSCIFI